MTTLASCTDRKGVHAHSQSSKQCSQHTLQLGRHTPFNISIVLFSMSIILFSFTEERSTLLRVQC